VNKQLPGWIQEGVSSGLRNLPPPPPVLTIEQIRDVVRAKQPKTNPFAEQIVRDKYERANQKVKEIFRQWMKEQMQEAEEKLAKKMEEQSAHLKRIVNPPTTIGEEREMEAR
jgi:gas vesicle protein